MPYHSLGRFSQLPPALQRLFAPPVDASESHSFEGPLQANGRQGGGPLRQRLQARLQNRRLPGRGGPGLLAQLRPRQGSGRGETETDTADSNDAPSSTDAQTTEVGLTPIHAAPPVTVQTPLRPDYGPITQVTSNVQLRIKRGLRAGVIPLRPGLSLMVELPEQSCQSELGIDPLLTTLAVQAASAALSNPQTMQQLSQGAQHAFQTVANGVSHGVQQVAQAFQRQPPPPPRQALPGQDGAMPPIVVAGPPHPPHWLTGMPYAHPQPGAPMQLGAYPQANTPAVGYGVSGYGSPAYSTAWQPQHFGYWQSPAYPQPPSPVFGCAGCGGACRCRSQGY